MPWTNYIDYSGGVQRKTSDMIQKPNEFSEIINGHFDSKIGALTARPGCEMVGWPTSGSKEILGLTSYTGYDNKKLIRAANNSAGTSSQLEWLLGDTWTAISGATSLPANAKSYFINFLDRLVHQGYAASSNSFVNTAILAATTYSSTENNVKYAPDAKYLILFNNQIYALNALVDGVRHKSRVYYSSIPRSIVTYVNGDQSGMITSIQVDSVKYLKAGMVIDIYTGGTDRKIVDSLTLTGIDYTENVISFVPRNLTLTDKDEIYLEDQKGNLNVLWDTREGQDYYEVKTNDGEEVMGGFVNQNRLVIGKKNSLHKVVGVQTIEVSNTIGIYSPDSIQNIGGYTIFFHNTGFYRYTDGQMPELISQPVEDYVKAMSGGNWDKVVAGNESDQIYIAYIGELQDLGKDTTSTSTSSTSTSSTSSSTSSTSTSSTTISTSSTSTSSTSTSTSATTVSTSSTSSSTSSTSSSVSTSSTSSSTSSTSSSTSLSTSTIASTGTDYYAVAFYANMQVWSIYKFPFQIKTITPYEMHGVKKLYFGDQLGRVIRYGVGHSDCGNAIPLMAKTHPFDDGAPYGEKEYQKLKVYAQNGEECKTAISFDEGEYEPVMQLDENSKEHIFKPAQKAEKYSLMYSQSDTTIPPVIKGHSMLIDPVGEQI